MPLGGNKNRASCVVSAGAHLLYSMWYSGKEYRIELNSRIMKLLIRNRTHTNIIIKQRIYLMLPQYFIFMELTNKKKGWNDYQKEKDTIPRGTNGLKYIVKAG